jgi:glycosyltransferase, family 1
MKKIVLLNNIARDIIIFRKHLIQYLIAHNYTVYALATDFTEESKREVKSLGAIPFSYSFARGGLNPLADLKNMLHLTRILRKIQPDVVLSSFAKPVIFGTMAAKRAHVPKIIAMVEGLGFPFTEQPTKRTLKAKIVRRIQIFLYRLSLPLADTVIFLNHDDPSDLLDKNHIKVKKTIILGGIGLNLADYPFTPAPEHPISFIFVARLLREKGIFEFLQAAKQIKNKYPNTIFKVIGNFDYENPGALKKEELQKYVQQDIIYYPGFVQDVNEYFAKSSVFVLPSYREGLPRSTQEAMAIGRPIITTDVPGCRETVINGQNGFLIPKWNVPALVSAMEYFILNPSEITRMGLESYQIAVEKFDGKKVNQKLLNIIQQ